MVSLRGAEHRFARVADPDHSHDWRRPPFVSAPSAHPPKYPYYLIVKKSIVVEMLDAGEAQPLPLGPPPGVRGFCARRTPGESGVSRAQFSSS